MNLNFIDDPVLTYGYHNCLPETLTEQEDNDDPVIIPPKVDILTDTEKLN